MAEKSIDGLFQFMAHIDQKDRAYFLAMSDKELKGFAPVVITRWLTGTYNKSQVAIINQIVNPYVFSLHHHPLLIWFLLLSSTTGKPQRYSWTKPLTGKGKDNACIQCIKEYFNYNTREAELVYNTIEHKVVLDMAEELGYQESEMFKIKKELGFVSSTAKAPAGKKKTKKQLVEERVEIIF